MLEAELARLSEDYELSVDNVVAIVERGEFETRPPLDLDLLAGGKDAPAVLARLILALEGEDDGMPPEFAGLLQDSVDQVRGAWRARPYLTLSEEDAAWSPAEMARSALARQASLLLDHLLAQKGGS
jgi:hypothetical protein